MSTKNAPRRQREFPRQHQGKPGSEAALDPPPMYDAPFYAGSRKLENRVTLITGGESGIGRAVAILFAREGADVAMVYLNEHADANATKESVEAEGRRCILIAGLASPRCSSYITGEILPIIGGYSGG